MVDLERTHRRAVPPRLARKKRTARIVHSPDPGAVGRELPLDGSKWLIGRGASGLGGVGDPHMSREHAQLIPVEQLGDYFLEDLETSNGCLLNGTMIERPEPISPGDVLSLGHTLLVVDEEPSAGQLPVSWVVDGQQVKEVLGISYTAQRLRKSIATVAAARGTVLILGKTGVGKEVAARAIHRLSPRATGPWVPVNCAAIPGEIAESELFGYKRGAFTGAVTDRDGYFVQASGGALFLDEIGDLPLPLQAKLLRVLEDGTVQQVGGSPSLQIDLRVIAATHVDLDTTGFRQDLLARLGDWILHIPPLAERRSDILVLWDHFQRQEAPQLPLRRCTAEFAEGLLLHDWPMNIRELQKLARRILTLADPDAPFDLSLLPDPMQMRIRSRYTGARTVAASLDADDREHERHAATLDLTADQDDEGGVPDQATLEDALRSAKGNVSRVAETLGVHRTQVYRWLRRYHVDPEQYR